MTPITCIIVDDEPLAVKLLESFVAKTPQLQLLASFTDSVEALCASCVSILYSWHSWISRCLT